MNNKKHKILVATLCVVLLLSLALTVACNANVTITFDTNGGSKLDPIKAKAGEDISSLLPANPERAGYNFTGWYSDKACTDKVALPTVMPDKDVTFYAGWAVRASAKLTLTTGEGGTLVATSYDVYVGDNLATFLADKAPTPQSGLEFGGWFENGSLMSSERTMPAGGLTLTAKYLATYTVNVYAQDTDGNYPATATQITGKGYYGEAFTYVPENEHFTLDNSKTNRVESSSLGKNEQFTVYLARGKVEVNFYANAPEGANPADTIPCVECYFGAEIVLPDASAYALASNFRFAGWSENPIGNVQYAPNQTIVVEDKLYLFARWEIGRADVFGGTDYIFVSLTEANTVYLYREGLERSSSSYNPTTGIFIFESNGKEALSGRVTSEGFYYFYDTEQRIYTSNTDNASLELKAHGEAVYKPENGSAINGNYEVDFATGDYIFRGGNTTFNFRLNITASSATFTKRGEEFGYYAQSYGSYGYGYIVLYLDGYGGGLEIWDPADPYVDMYGIAYYTFDISYRDFGMYYTITIVDDGSTYNVMFDSSQKVTFEDYKLSGTFLMEDYFEHEKEYKDRFGSYDYLQLDGFGGSSELGAFYYKNGVKIYGAYEEVYSEFWYTTDGIYYNLAYDSWVRFTADNGDVYNFRLTEEEYTVGGSSYYSYFFELIGGPFGMYDFDNWFVMEGAQFTGFLYFRGDNANTAELWILADVIEDGDTYFPVFVLYDKGAVTNTDDVYLFNGEHGSIRFRFDADNYLVALDTDLVIVEDELIIDGDGKAWFIDGSDRQEVEYFYEEGMFVMYAFAIGNSERYFILNEEGIFVEIDASNIYDVEYLDTNRAYNYTARIMMLDDNEVLVGIRLTNGRYNYALIGYATVVAEGEYKFVMDDYWLSAGSSQPIIAEYGEFRFKLGIHVFYIYDEEYNLEGVNGERLVTDGYGNATYTPATGGEVKGTYATVENLILFRSSDSIFTALRLNQSNMFAVVTLGDHELGYYYTYDDEGYRDYNYFFFDGNGVAIFFQFDSAHQVYEQFVGSYELYDGDLPEGFEDYAQYKILLGSEEYLIVAAPLDSDSNDIVGYFEYYLFDAAFYYDGDIVGGGHIYANGYEMVGLVVFGAGLLPSLNEDVELLGIVYRTDIPDSYDFFDLYNLPSPNAEGKSLIFIPLADSSIQFIFDITADGAVLRTQAHGTYVEYRDGITLGRTILLDGHGKALLRDGERNVIDQGAYEQVDIGLGNYTYHFVGADNDFIFRISLEAVGGTFMGDYLYVFVIYTGDDGVYTSDDTNNWTVFVLDGFGGARYVDRYGRATEGSYNTVVDDIIVFRSYSFTWYIRLDENGYNLISDEFIIKDGVLYAYQGKSSSLTIPSGVTEIAHGAFADVKMFMEINFNDVTVIGDNAFAGSWIEVVSSTKIEYIGARAFYDCYFLTTVNLPKVKEIGEGAFIACNYLTSVTLGDVEQIGAYAFTLANFAPRVIFDFTGVAHPENITISENAFIRTFGGKDPQYADGKLIDFRIVVKDMDALNALFGSESWPATIKKYATITRDTSNMERLYYDFAHCVLYNINGGLFIETYYDPELKGLQYGAPVGIYTSNNGKFTIYLAGDDGYSQGVEAADVFELGDSVIFRSGTTFTVTSNNESHASVEINFSIIHDQDSNGEYFVFGIKVNGVDAEIDMSTGVITVTIDNKTYAIKVTSADSCSVEEIVE